MVDLLAYHYYSEEFASYLAIVLNVLLIFLVWKIKSQAMHQYNIIIIQTCVIDLLSVGAHLLGHPFFIIINGTKYAFINGGIFQTASPGIRFFFFNYFCFMLFFSITALPVEFIYRYRLLCLNEQTSLKRYSCLLLGSIFGASCYGIVCYIGYYVYGAKYTPNAKKELGWLIGYEIEAIGAVVFGTVPNYFVVFFAGILTFGSYTIVIYCNIKIIIFMKQNEHIFSSGVRRANRELNIMLAVQAALPLILYVVPMGFFVIGLLVPNKPSVILSIFSTFTFGWIPVGNAACALLFVSAYRNLLFNFLHCKQSHIHDNFLHLPIQDTRNYTFHANHYKNNFLQ